MRAVLGGGAYQARSVVAAAQRQLNLFSEPVPEAEGEPAPAVLFPTPGLRLLTTLPDAPVRGIRQATNGVTYVVAGSGVYSLNSVWDHRLLGRIQGGHTPVSIAENGLSLVIVDGSRFGWSVDLTSGALAEISTADGAFRGGSTVAYLDTYLVFSVPGATEFYSSDSLALTFDPLWFAAKQGAPDSLVGLVAAKAEIWLLGERSTEVWYDSGAADFPFQRQAGVFIDHGCAAVGSISVLDNQVYWLSRDRLGQGIVVRGGGYQATRVSTYAIEAAIASYGSISDAIGMSYVQNGHMFYVLTFPSADKTWMLDATTGLWSELAWLDTDGVEHRHRANCLYACGNLIVCGDWQTGALYALDPAVYTDVGRPIKRLRSWPHTEGRDGQRMTFSKFQANISVAQAAVTTATDDLNVFLSWSDDRGVSFGNPVAASVGATGQYLTSVQFQRLGMARSRVFALSWSCPFEVALLGAWIDASPAIS